MSSLTNEIEMEELVLHNARVVTLDSRMAEAGMVIARNGRIAEVGQRFDSGLLETKNPLIIDCRGKTVVPGFIDAHTHFLAYASSLVSVGCSPESVASIEDIRTAITRRALETPIGAWIKGGGYNEFYLAEKRHPNRWDLDPATEHHPVKVTHRSGHACVLNSYAMRLAGITTETPDPKEGAIERDLNTGEPTGIFIDLNEWLDQRLGSSERDTGMEVAVQLASERYVSMGITSFQDASVPNSLVTWHLFQRLKEEGWLLPRAVMMLGFRHLQEAMDAGLAYRSGDDDLRLGPVKVVLSQTTGALYPTEAELKEIVQAAVSQGFPVAIHAVEQAEIEAAIEVLEWAEERFPRRGLRHRIEHCSVCPPVLQERLQRLGPLIVTQPGFVYYSGERYLYQVPREQLPGLYPIKSLRERGLRVAGSSDSPVAPPDPLMAIRASVTRRASNGEVVVPSEGIPASEALRMYTVDGAYAACEEDVKGTIAPGKLADIAILSDDPTQVDAEAIGDIEVCGTILNGKLVWQKDGIAVSGASRSNRSVR